MNLSAPFIRRPVATMLLAIAILLSGYVAYRLLPVAPLPKVDMPTIMVNATFPGASPETMASSVATPLERRFGRISGVTEITSTNSLGATSIVLQFDISRDIDSAGRDVQAAIAAAGAELPAGMPTRPIFRKVNPADMPILVIALTSNTLPIAQIFDAANSIIAQKIAQVKGVGQVFVMGGQQPAVRIQVDPVRLAAMGLTLENVRATLAASTIDQPKGMLSSDEQSFTIAADDQLFHAEQFRQIILANRNDSSVRLGEVANVVDSVENLRSAGWTNGKRTVGLMVRRQPGANILETIDRVKSLLPQLSHSISPQIKFEIAVDRAGTIRASVRDVERTLILSVFLVTLVVFVFLRRIRASLIPSIAVPVSLVGTFGVMYLLDYSLNNLSLMALTIATGFVVDDAIVVTENISRHIELGHTPLQAALLGSKQIGFTVVSITISLLAVFVPVLFMGGIIGNLFREFAVSLSVAVGISAVVSLTLTPMMCSRLLDNHQPRHGWAYRASERFFDGMLNGYSSTLAWCIGHRRIMGGVTVFTIAATIGMTIVVPKGLFPQQDTSMLSGFAEAPQDISYPAMLTRMSHLNKILLDDPDVLHVSSFTGGSWGASAANTGNFFIELKERPARKTSIDEVIARLRPKIAQNAGINLYLQPVQDVRLGGRSSRTQYQYSIQTANLDELRHWAPKLLSEMRRLPEIKDVVSDQQSSGLELALTIDRDAASRLGVSMVSVDSTLYDAFGQRQVATNYTELNQYRVVLEMLPILAGSPDALDRVYFPGSNGIPIPLKSVATSQIRNSSLSITHQGQFPCTTISFNLAPKKSLGDAVAAINAAQQKILLPPSVIAGFQGTAQAFQASLANEPVLIAAAILIVYLVLGILYESFIHPITILSTLPSAGLGAFLALYVCKSEFNIIALVGILLLIGIVKKNAILMIDFALEEERLNNTHPVDAIFRAATLRFRPIMMTTAAAVFGNIPLAVGVGSGSELRQPLGITIVGGLVVSQLLTLYTTPLIYLAMGRFAKRPTSYYADRGNPVAV